ncbi:MAG: DNA internalization-related competence protein ComEC/Rec2 [Halanaerobiaceae bacterium]
MSLKKFPMLVASLALAGGIIIGYYLAPVVVLLLAGAVAGILFWARERGYIKTGEWHSKQWLFTYIFLAAFILGCFLVFYGEYRYESRYSVSRWNGREVNVEGKVIEPLSDLEGDVLYVKPHKIDGNKVRYGLIQVQKDELVAEQGSIISTRIYLEKPRKQMNPGGFSHFKYLKRQDIFALGYLQGEISYAGRTGMGIKRSIIGLKKYLLGVIGGNMDEPYSGIVKALILGERSELSQEKENYFTQAGASHLLAISGLHVGFVVLILFWFFKILSFPHLLRNLLLTVILLIYVIITGGRSSVLRAGFLSLLFLWAPYFNRQGSLFNCLGFALLVNLIINPYSLFTAGLQLTYLVVVSIVLWSGFFRKFFLYPIAVSVSAQLGSFPITAYYFNTVVPMGIVTNIWAIPLTGLIVILALGGLALSLINPLFFAGVGQVLQILLWLLNTGIEFLARLPGGSLEVGTPPVYFLIIYFGYIIVLPYLLKTRYIPVNIRRQKWWLKFATAAAAVIVLVVIWPWSPSDDQMETVFLSVGHGDSIYIETPKGDDILVDGGGGFGIDGSHGESTVLPFLRHRGVHELDLVVVTHFHQDHARGIIDILEEQKVERLLLPTGFARNELAREIIYLARRADIPIQVASAGMSFSNGQFRLQVLHPDEGGFRNENNNSLVLRAVYGNFSLLLTGDIEAEGEQQILKRYDVRSSVLKFAHHGAPESSTEEFLRSAAPGVGVISCGENNYGHPAPEVIGRAEKQGINIRRTDKSGAIIIRSDGERYTVEEFLK